MDGNCNGDEIGWNWTKKKTVTYCRTSGPTTNVQSCRTLVKTLLTWITMGSTYRSENEKPNILCAKISGWYTFWRMKIIWGTKNEGLFPGDGGPSKRSQAPVAQIGWCRVGPSDPVGRAAVVATGVWGRVTQWVCKNFVLCNSDLWLSRKVTNCEEETNGCYGKTHNSSTVLKVFDTKDWPLIKKKV